MFCAYCEPPWGLHALAAADTCWGQPQLHISAAPQTLSHITMGSMHKTPWLKLGGISEAGCLVSWASEDAGHKHLWCAGLTTLAQGWVWFVSQWRQEGRGKLSVQQSGQYGPHPDHFSSFAYWYLAKWKYCNLELQILMLALTMSTDTKGRDISTWLKAEEQCWVVLLH